MNITDIERIHKLALRIITIRRSVSRLAKDSNNEYLTEAIAQLNKVYDSLAKAEAAEITKRDCA